MAPTMAPGKISYLQIPALDIERSAAFYATVFGWRLRRRSDGALAFDDGVGEVSGTWVTGPPPGDRPGVLVCILVEDVRSSLDQVVRAGGAVVEPADGEGVEVTARISDPAGNVLGIFQEAGT